MTRGIAFALIVAMAGGAATGARAATAEEQKACRSDAMKYCSSHIGKPAEMSACLAQNKDKLSDACRAVVEAHGG